VKQQLIAQADRQALHAECVARRIVELGGVPDLRTETLPQRSVIDYEGTPADPREIFLPALIEDDLVARQIAADAYAEMVHQLSREDPWTCSMLADIASAERAHADGLADLLRSVSSHRPSKCQVFLGNVS
jgi:bacterioferritin